MKASAYLSIVSVFCLSILLSACSGTKNLPSTEALIVGMWEATSITSAGITVDAKDLDDLIGINFRADKTVTFITGDIVNDGTYLIQGNKIIDPESTDQDHATIVELDKQKLILEMDDEGEMMRIDFKRQ